MNDYSLLDFGDGRRLERFGPFVFDRLCPAAENVRKSRPGIWEGVDFRFVPDEKFRNSERGRWTPNVPEPFEIMIDPIRFELRASSFGHLGVFPEQQTNWLRLHREIGRESKNRTETIRVLNLFAYTGGSSLAAAMAGPNIEVVHVDSSKSVVDRARRNAALNGIGRIRFIVDDVRKFVRRELKRGNRYEAVILDPPTYGHGLKGEPWRLAEDLAALLADLVALLADAPVLLLLTAHTPTFDADRLRNLLFHAGLPEHFHPETFSMDLESETGNRLPSGHGVFAIPAI